ncbi:unnamed protein product, partial [Toxocara canis]|uniref:RNA uridylyltransferase n=1 Tax=Toxocara canis TaxID=6265 RepID=A0A183V820_TOXCA
IDTDTGYSICTASRLVHSADSSCLPAKRLWKVEESVPQDVTREDEKGGSPVDVIRNERSNWEYGPSGGAATRRKRRRTKRYAVRQIDDTKGPEEDGEACPTNQMEDYVVEDDWSLKAVSNCTRKTDNCDTVVKLNLDREPGATVTEIENEDDVVSLPDEDVELIDQLKRLTVGENWSIASGVTSCEEAVESVAIVQQNELAEHCSDKVIAGSSPAAPQPIPEVKEKHVPFVVPETELDGVEIEYNRAIHLHNGTLEVKFEKDKRKDYVHIVAYECSGGQRPERISRHSFRICASSVLSAESSEEDLRNALLDTVKKLEKVSADSLISAEKRPYEISECSLPYLAKRCVRPLKNRSVRFNRSIYYCNACHFHINSVGHAVTHFESKEHQQAEQRKASLRRLRAVPSPSGAHLEKVAELLRDRLEETSLPPNAYGDIELLVEAVNEMLARLVHQDCSVQLYGSYLVQNASPQSNVNLSLTFPGSFTPGQIVTRVTQVLENAHLGRWTVCEMTTDLQCSCPTICFRLKPNENSGVSQLKNVALSVQSTRYFKTSRLVATYGHIRPQFVQISRIFRNWAQMKEELPQLETSNETTAIDYEDNEERIMAQIGVDNEEWDMATLWTELFRYYVLDHPTESLVQIRFSGSDKNNPSMVDCAHWNKKRLAVEDPCAPERVMQPSQYFAEFFSSCFLTTFLYFWIPQTASGPLLSYKLHIPNTTVASSKKLRKKRGVEEEGSGDRKGMREPGESAKAICKEEGHFATGRLFGSSSVE